MNRLSLLLIIGLLVIGLTSCTKKQEAAATEKPQTVKNAPTEIVKRSSVDEFYEAVGTVHSKTSTTLSAKVVGTITAMNVREGDRVRAGQTLVEIENRDARAQIEKAQAGVREAQSSIEEVDKSIRVAESAKTAAEANRQLAATTFKRYQTLLERKSVSPQEFDEVQARLKVADAEVERAERLLQSIQARKKQALARIDLAQSEVAGAQVYASYARITSPISGIVTAKQADVGTLAAPGTSLLTIEDSSYRLEAAVEESRIREIRLNALATVTLDALGGEQLSGRVVEIVPTADPASRSYTVKIALPAQQFLRSGLFGKARFLSGQRELITVPEKSLVRRGQLVGVYIVDAAGLAQMRLITMGKSYGERIEVLSGLSEDDRIVADGPTINREGVKVQ